MSIFDRFPKFQEIVPVYSVGVAFLYTWTLMGTFKTFTSNWIKFLDVSDILLLFAYMFFAVFVESLFVIVVILLVSFFAPKIVRAKKFILYGTILSATSLGVLMILHAIYGVAASIQLWAAYFLCSAAFLLVMSETFNKIRAFVEGFAERSVVFLYFYMPVSFVSVILVVIRNISL